MAVEFDIERFVSDDMEHGLGTYWMRIPEQIRLLNRLVYLEWAGARVIAGWVPAAEEFSWKCDLVKMVWRNMTIADRLLGRKQELASSRTVTIPSPELQGCLQAVAAADGFWAWAAGWFLELTRAQIALYEQFAEALDALFDAPTLEILEEVLPKKRQQLAWATAHIHDAVSNPDVLQAVTLWRTYTRHYLAAIGGPGEAEGSGAIPATPITAPYGPAPRQRSRPPWLKLADLQDPPPEFSGNLRTFMWHNATEIQVVDRMCYIFYGVDDMPFEFYVDLSRHIWDETRHHQMGVRRLQQMGYDLRDIPLPYGTDAAADLEEAYAYLTMFAEACSFGRKRGSMQAYYARGDIISGMTAEIDISDERSHVRYGKKWLTQLYRQRFGDQSTLNEIVERLMQGRVRLDEQGNFTGLTDEEKEQLSHAAFCGRVEFKYLNFERP